MRSKVALAVAAIIFLCICDPLQSQTAPWNDAFDSGRLDPKRWIATSEADFEEKTIDVVNSRLRLRAATEGTDDSTVKFLGVRSARRFRFGTETRFRVDLDWNNQANGSYLTAGMILAPKSNGGNPLREADWLMVQYHGVPPGKNGRIEISMKNRGRQMTLFEEGWPERNREGRPISLQNIEVVIRGRAVEVWENGERIFQSKPDALLFDSAHIYLQMSTHSNYRARELFFDNVRVQGAR